MVNMRTLVKRNTESKVNAFHKSACSCLTQCIVGCTGSGNAGNINWVEQQVRYNQRADGIAYDF